MSKTRQWLFLDAVAVLAVLGLGWFLLVAPQRTEAAELTAATEQQHATAQSLTGQLQVLRAQAAELPSRQARLAELQAQVPEDTSIPTLIRLLTAAADDTGVELVTLSPSPAQPTGDYTRVPITLEVRGGYFSLEQYLAALEDLPRAFLVDGFTVTRTESTSSDLQLSLTGSVFTSAGAESASPGATPAPAAAAGAGQSASDAGSESAGELGAAAPVR